MLKILVFGSSDNLGGIEKYLYEYMSRMKCLDIYMVKMYNSIPFEKEYLDCGIKIVNITNYKKNIIKNIYQIFYFLKKFNINIIYMNMFSSSYCIPIIIGKILRTEKIITHAHSSNTNGIIKKIIHLVNRNWFVFSNKKFSCSDVAGKWFYKKNYYVINNAIDLTKYSFSAKKRNKIKNQLNIENNFVIGHVGRMDVEKNHFFLLDVFFEILKINKTMKLMLVGSGSMENILLNRCRELKMDGKVIFLKNRNDVDCLLQAMDYFVFPSLYEGLPITLIEAQASGVKCLVSDTVSREVAITDLVKFMSLRESPDLWAEHICNNIIYQRNTDSIKIMTDKGFNIDREAKKLESMFLEIP
jgi:glycosyltransferase involved in cell wall biosynthesis